METEPQQPKEREGVLSALNGFIEAFNFAKEISSNTPAKAVFSSVSVLLVMIRDTMVNKVDYVELGLACADVCATLRRGLDGKSEDDLNDSVREAIGRLRRAMEEIQARITKQGKRNVVSRHLHAKNDKERIAAWRLDLVRILHVFNTELAINTHLTVSGTHDVVSNTHTVVSNTHNTVSDTHIMVSDIHRTIIHGQEGNNDKHSSVGDSRILAVTEQTLIVPQTRDSIPGEFPPLPPRTFFGRDELVEKIVDLAEDLTPIALIGAGGIGKTSVALTVLHDDRIKRRFGHDRRFIRCDQFPASRAHFLRRLSKVTSAGIENPEDLTPLYPFLSSKEMVIVLDNAESILDPQGTDARKIYAVVEELSRFNNLCILITSRISTTPSDCTRLDIPTLPLDAARDTFYRIHGDSNRTDLINTILEQLDFHPLSITLLATVASQNRWDVDRLTREWKQHRTRLLQTQHNNSLAAAIELSLTSPLFQNLGLDARSLLEVIAFFPQGVNENNLEWFFPTISDRANIFDKFCTLSLTYRNGEFVTMLAPLRDYLRPKDPKASSLLGMVKGCYFTKMSVRFNPNSPGFAEARWIVSEDVNVEHLLDVFTTIDTSSIDVWGACVKFMEHLSWHKNRLTILGPKIERLPDDHSSKPLCLYGLAKLFAGVGHRVECKRLLAHALGLYRERGSDHRVARVLRFMSGINLEMGLCKEGMEQAREAIEISERLGDTLMQTYSLIKLASLLQFDKQLDAAGETISRAINLIGEKGDQHLLSASYRTLGEIYESKGEIEQAVSHFEMSLEIATPFNWHDQLFWTHISLAELSCNQARFEDAQVHIERASQYTARSPYCLARVTRLQAGIWYKQHRHEEARSEALRAANAFEKLGAAEDMAGCKGLLQAIQEELDVLVSSG